MAQWNDYHHEDEDVDGEERDESGGKTNIDGDWMDQYWIEWGLAYVM